MERAQFRSANLAFALLILLACPPPVLAAEKQSRPGLPGLARIDAVVEKAIAEDELPGAIILIGHRGRVVYRKAFGSKALLPAREPMRVDTIFDVA